MTEVTFINLTPHPLNLRQADGTDLTVSPDPAGPARVMTTPGEDVDELNGIALYGATQFGEVEGLPAPKAATIYIVSGLVAGQVKDRADVVAPGTGPQDGAVRSEKGHIVAVTRLVKAC